MEKKIVLLPGDGIGTEIMQSAKEVLDVIAKRFNHVFEFQEQAIGGDAVDRFNTPLPDETIRACQDAEAILLGAVGGQKWYDLLKELRPERGLLGIRKTLGLFANLRPIQGFAPLLHASPLKEEIIDRKSTRLNSSHVAISYAVFCLKKKKTIQRRRSYTLNKDWNR